MKNLILTTQLLLCFFTTKAQDLTKISDEITAEGKLLYSLEMASWYGTDIALEKFKGKTENIGGYFSYSDGDYFTCVFFNKARKIVAKISFDSTFSPKTAKTDYEVRDFMDNEKRIFAIRNQTLNKVNTDSMYKHFDDTNLNLIPVLGKKESKVYILTGPEKGGVVVFGNDYLLTFDEKDQFVSQKKLHNSMIPIEYDTHDPNKTAIGAAHTHLTELGDFITPTDICTLMLYEKSAKWQLHYVFGGKYVSMWDCTTNSLRLVTKEEFEKETQGEKGSKKKNKRDKN